MSPPFVYSRHPSFHERTLLAIIRIAFGMVFVLSGAMKVIAISEFRRAVADFGLVPPDITPFVALGITSFEIYIGVAIVLNLRTPLTSKIGVIMLGIFTAVLVSSLATGNRVSCGCFGSLSSGSIDGWTIVRNLILGVAGVLVSSFSYVNSRDAKEGRWPTMVPEAHLIKSKFFESLYQASLLTIVLSLVTVSALLSFQNKTLKERLGIISGNTLSMKSGDTARPFEAVSVSGRRIVVDFGGTYKTALFVMKGNCNACKSNVAAWKRLATILSDSGVRVIGLSMDSLSSAQGYAKENGLTFDLLSVPDRSFVSRYKILATPQTIMLDGSIVENVWRGILGTDQESEIITHAKGFRSEGADNIRKEDL